MDELLAPAKTEAQSRAVQQVIARYLCGQGLEEKLATVFSKVVVKHVLTWALEPADPNAGKAIIALSFGYRVQPNGGRTPGPVNEALAESVMAHYWLKPRPVYAQFEVAEALAGRVPSEDLKPIYPKIDAKTGGVQPLGSKDMLEAVLKQLRDPQRFDPWLLIAHRHHAARCAMIARSLKFSVIVPPDLPDLYDRECTQPWRRRHLPYLISDVISRLTMYVADVVYPTMCVTKHAAINAGNGEKERREREPNDQHSPRGPSDAVNAPRDDKNIFDDSLLLQPPPAALMDTVRTDEKIVQTETGIRLKLKDRSAVITKTREDTSAAAADILRKFGTRADRVALER